MTGSSSPHRLPPEVYRRRRIVVGVAAALVLMVAGGLISWGISGLVNEFSEAEPTPEISVETTEEVAETPTPSASPTPEVAQACTAEQLKLSAVTDKEEYEAGESPIFRLELENVGEVDCSVDVGSDAQLFRVSQNEEKVFSTRDCQVSGTNEIAELEPGQRESSTFTWERIGTDDACENVNEDLEAGEYELVVGLGDFRSQPTKFILK